MYNVIVICQSFIRSAREYTFIYLPPKTQVTLKVDPCTADVKVIAVSKRNLSKTRLCVHFRQFPPINNLMLSLLDLPESACCYFSRVPLFEKPRREGILPLCRASLPRAVYTQKLQYFLQTQKNIGHFKA